MREAETGVIHHLETIDSFSAAGSRRLHPFGLTLGEQTLEFCVALHRAYADVKKTAHQLTVQEPVFWPRSILTLVVRLSEVDLRRVTVFQK